MAILNNSANVPSSASYTVLDGDSIGESHFDDERLLVMEPFEVLDNPVVGQHYRWLEQIPESNGEHLVIEIRFQADAKNYPEHVHPRADETYKVLSGEFVVTIGGEERMLGTGEEITLPAGVPHTHGNVPGTETCVLYNVGPLTGEEHFFRTLVALARDGKTDDEGVPSMLQLAVSLNTYPDMVYVTSPPVSIQKPLFKFLAPVGRLLGYTADYPTAQPEASL